MLSFLNSLASGQGGVHLSRYIPATNAVGLMPRDVATKCTLRQRSHMMPMCTGIAAFLVQCVQDCSDGEHCCLFYLPLAENKEYLRDVSGESI